MATAASLKPKTPPMTLTSLASPILAQARPGSLAQAPTRDFAALLLCPGTLQPASLSSTPGPLSDWGLRLPPVPGAEGLRQRMLSRLAGQQVTGLTPAGEAPSTRVSAHVTPATC